MLMPVVSAVALGVMLSSAGVGAPAPSASAPPVASCANQKVGGRTSHSLAYDPASHRTLMFGGVSSDTTDGLPGSLWAWDGQRWTCLAADGPPGRADAFLGYDVARHRLVLFGGRVFESGRRMRFMRDTWEWDGTRWTQVDTAGPAPRIHGAIAYDAVRRAIVIHGGGGAEDIRNDTWEWTGTVWRQIPRRVPGGIGDALLPTSRGVTYLIATRDTSPQCASRFRATLFEPVADSVRRVAAPGPCLSPVSPATAAPDGFLLFLGWNKDEPATAWVWTPNEWRRTESAPPRRRGTAMAYDNQRRRVVLFGGEDETGILGDTWEWDGRQWTRVAFSVTR